MGISTELKGPIWSKWFLACSGWGVPVTYVFLASTDLIDPKEAPKSVKSLGMVFLILVLGHIGSQGAVMGWNPAPGNKGPSRVKLKLALGLCLI